jgi:hypothetical protein
MMNATGWFSVFIIPMFLSGFVVGRFFLANELYLPFPIATVGKISFATLTIFLVLRSIQLSFIHESVNMFNLISGYADITFLVGGLMLGYSRAPIRQAKSIKSGLAISEDGGVQIVAPFADPAEVALSTTNRYERSNKRNTLK